MLLSLMYILIEKVVTNFSEITKGICFSHESHLKYLFYELHHHLNDLSKGPSIYRTLITLRPNQEIGTI